MTEFEDGFGERVVRERVFAACFKLLELGFDEGMVGHREGESRDDDIAQRITGDIDTAPETFGPEEHMALIFLELLHKRLPGKAFALDEKFVIRIVQFFTEEGCRLGHVAIVREKDEGAAFRAIDEGAYLAGEFCHVAGFIFWIRHLGHGIHLHLVRIVERATDLLIVDVPSADPVLEIVKAALGDAEGGTGHDAAVVGAKEEVFEIRGDVDWSGVQGDRLLILARLLDPVDLVFVFEFEE